VYGIFRVVYRRVIPDDIHGVIVSVEEVDRHLAGPRALAESLGGVLKRVPYIDARRGPESQFLVQDVGFGV
jgi:hypothetical protein